MLNPGVYVISSESVEGKSYDLKIVKKGRGMQFSCTCPGFHFRKSCKHVTSAKDGEYVA